MRLVIFLLKQFGVDLSEEGRKEHKVDQEEVLKHQQQLAERIEALKISVEIQSRNYRERSP